jgi:hypothetical protein
MPKARVASLSDQELATYDKLLSICGSYSRRTTEADLEREPMMSTDGAREPLSTAAGTADHLYVVPGTTDDTDGRRTQRGVAVGAWPSRSNVLVRSQRVPAIFDARLKVLPFRGGSRKPQRRGRS